MECCFSDFFLKMDTDAGNESDVKAISEPVVATEDVPMNNNVVEADVKPIDSNEGGVNVQDDYNTASSANGGTTEERTMSKREQKRALKRKVEQRGFTTQSRQNARLFSIRPNWDPSPAGECISPCFGSGGRGTLACGRGGGESQFRRGDRHCGTLGTGIYVCTLCSTSYVANELILLLDLSKESAEFLIFL
jgi:hypothetical protein